MCLLAAGITQDSDLEAGLVAKYEILHREDGSLFELGRSAMGVTYKALDRNLHCHVALKAIQAALIDDTDVRERFFQEARTAARIRHPNVAAVFHLEDNGSTAYYAREFVDGFTLAEVVHRRGRLGTRQSLEIVSQITRALGAADKLGLAHRDIKPSNIMLVPQDDGDFLVKVINFGLAKLRPASPPGHGGPGVATAPVADSVECFGNNVDIRSDIYALGLTLWIMLTGVPPVESTALAIDPRSQDLPFERLEALPKAMVLLLRKMLHADPAQRPQNPAQLQLAIYECENAFAPHKPWLWRRAGLLAGGAVGLLMAVAVLMMFFINKPDAPEPSLVVLPFDNIGGDPASAWFGNSLTDEITTRLAQIPHLKVVSHGSALTFANSNKRPPEIARELGVTAVLEGSAVRVGDEFRISTRLIDAAADRVLVANAYNHRMDAIFDVQADLAVSVAAALKTSIGPKQLVRLRQKPTQSVPAYDYYLQGRDYYSRYEKIANEQAIELFKKALEVDPNYALAFSGLADAYAQISARYGGDPKWLDEGLVMAEKALKLDPDLAEAHKAAGTVHAVRGAYRKSLEANLQAVALNPNLTTALINIGVAYRETGRLDEAIPWFQKAVRLDPLNAPLRSNIGDLYAALNDPQKAAELYKRGLDLQPDRPEPRIGLCRLDMLQGKPDAARRKAAEILKSFSEDSGALEFAAQASFFTGDFATAKELYSRLLASNRTGDVLYYGGVRYLTALGFLGKESGDSSKTVESLLTEAAGLDEDAIRQGPEYAAPIYDLAAVNAIRGQYEQACDLLERAIAAGWTDYPSLLIDPRFSTLRSDARFRKLISGIERKVEEMRGKALDNVAYAKQDVASE